MTISHKNMMVITNTKTMISMYVCTNNKYRSLCIQVRNKRTKDRDLFI